jgi:hypothetical protein
MITIILSITHSLEIPEMEFKNYKQNIKGSNVKGRHRGGYFLKTDGSYKKESSGNVKNISYLIFDRNY